MTVPRSLVLLLVVLVLIAVILDVLWEMGRRERKRYYNDDYLKSDAWQRKRALVLKRDRSRCQQCGALATQVHHKRYARNIGREPIRWLEAVCESCHRRRPGK